MVSVGCDPYSPVPGCAASASATQAVGGGRAWQQGRNGAPSESVPPGRQHRLSCAGQFFKIPAECDCERFSYSLSSQHVATPTSLAMTFTSLRTAGSAWL